MSTTGGVVRGPASLGLRARYQWAVIAAERERVEGARLGQTYRLLVSQLSWLQEVCLVSRSWLLVQGSLGGWYVLGGSIVRIRPDGCARLCLHAGDGVDALSELLSVILLARSAEGRLRRLANVEGPLPMSAQLDIRYELGLLATLIRALDASDATADLSAACRSRVAAVTAFENAPSFDEQITWGMAA